MALWPFRRKSRKKRPRVTTTDFEEFRGRAAEPVLPPRSQTMPDATMGGVETPPVERARKQRASPNKLQRKPRTYSFSPGRNDDIKVGRKMSARGRRQSRKTSTPADQPRRDDAMKVDSGVSALDEADFRRVPTLHNKRDGDHLPRKKSSKKRRKDDLQREAEIKAMSSFVPIRPATEDWMAGRPMKKDSKRIKTGLGRGWKGVARQEWEKDNRSSDISLPVPESIHSSLSSDSEHISYRISALQALAPRPTLRYTTHPRYPGSGDAATLPARRPSQRQQRKLSMPIPEATLKAHKRIDDLADDLNASDLRELMERDQRRREMKRQRELEKLEQKLARRAEKQAAADVEARKEGKESPPNMERGVLGRDSVGLGIDPASAVITSSKRRQADDASPRQRGKRPEGIEDQAIEDIPRPSPLAAFHRTTSIPLEAAENEELEEEVPPLKSPKSRSSFLRTKLARSKSPPDSEVKTEHSGSLKKGSETSSSKGPMSWTSIFKWGLKNKRSSEGPSSFSNTSRDSMQATPVPTPPVNFVPRRVSSGVPKRTMSRFREDLPELPISPPDSRVQSPEADPIPPTIPEASPDLNNDAGATTFPVPGQVDRYDTPTSEIEAMRQTPSTFGHPDEPPGPSPAPHSMSLASIDSEASWLSGRLSKKRKSSGLLQQSPTFQLPPRMSESDNEEARNFDTTNEDISIADDDYLSRVAHSGWNRKSTGEARPSSDGEEEAHWGSVRGQHPMLVHAHGVDRMKSREGLLNSFGEEGEVEVQGDVIPGEPSGNANDDSEGGDTEGEEAGGLQRATSVNLGKGHARHISAGSARLLELSPRSSTDMKRRSLTPNNL
ncbi:hypothetical protein B0H66DRAFT_257572 [Apodospora peruviana]|uniref:Uncharacterized protein n=1 Tax=Apodospora peruviana TaxID=516989 RepID=A0AAE0I610_9PEZI|nr:hypothetical protein B0H66DRAFT_257572 [Apodospora peruviana]